MCLVTIFGTIQMSLDTRVQIGLTFERVVLEL